MKNFAVLASGYGSNLQAIIHAINRKKITGKLVVVISDKPDAFALKRAQKAGIASVYLNPKQYTDREAFDRKLADVLNEYKVDWVVLAGYMRLLSPYFIRQFPSKIINIHPALLPSFKGMHGIRDAFEYGVKVTGVTVHFVSEEMDAGDIIAQDVVKISPQETLKSLEDKIHKAEHILYPQVIEQLFRRSLKRAGRRILLH